MIVCRVCLQRRVLPVVDALAPLVVACGSNPSSDRSASQAPGQGAHWTEGDGKGEGEEATNKAEGKTAEFQTDMTDTKPGEWHETAADGNDANSVASDERSAPNNFPRSAPLVSGPSFDLEVEHAIRNDVPSWQPALDERSMAASAADHTATVTQLLASAIPEQAEHDDEVREEVHRDGLRRQKANVNERACGCDVGEARDNVQDDVISDVRYDEITSSCATRQGPHAASELSLASGMRQGAPVAAEQVDCGTTDSDQILLPGRSEECGEAIAASRGIQIQEALGAPASSVRSSSDADIIDNEREEAFPEEDDDDDMSFTSGVSFIAPPELSQVTKKHRSKSGTKRPGGQSYVSDRSCSGRISQKHIYSTILHWHYLGSHRSTYSILLFPPTMILRACDTQSAIKHMQKRVQDLGQEQLPLPQSSSSAASSPLPLPAGTAPSSQGAPHLAALPVFTSFARDGVPSPKRSKSPTTARSSLCAPPFEGLRLRVQTFCVVQYVC